MDHVGASGSSSSEESLRFGKNIMHFELDNGGGKKVKMKGKAVADNRQLFYGDGAKQQQQTVLSSAPRCQVEGCNLDLSGSKAYYLKHRVCGLHSKAPKVVVSGVEQRFCQQCSRFHLLAEFDQRKRSCRRRLADHNERRRKPPPGSLLSQFGQLSSSFHEDSYRLRSFVMDFTNPQLPERRQDDGRIRQAIDQTTDNPRHDSANVQLSISASEVSTQQSQLLGGSGTCCAFSLLSTQQWGSRDAHVVSTSNNFGGNAADESNYIHGHMNNSSLSPLSALQQVAQTELTRNFSGELELALQGNRHQRPAFDFSRTFGQSSGFYNLSP